MTVGGSAPAVVADDLGPRVDDVVRLTESLPRLVQDLTEINPVTLTIDPTRALTIGTLVWLAALLAVFVPLAVRSLRQP